jgi:long-chain fatty acid transport protein
MNVLTRFFVAILVLGASVPIAQAGGYDTPMLYSARHMGVGGAAAGYVDDPSALYHNPAGLAHTESLSLMINVSPLGGYIEGAPAPNTQAQSETTFAPFFLLGANYRINDWMTVGLALFPVASAGAEYQYESAGASIVDRTKLVFYEATPGFGFNLPGNLRLGVGYRITYMTLERFQGNDMAAGLDFELSGLNAASFRVGLQWTPIEDEAGADGTNRNELQIGSSYRHRTDLTIENDSGKALFEFTDISSEFVLPAKFNLGARYDTGRLGFVSDFEYTLQSQNESSSLAGTDPSGMFREVANIFGWQDSITVRVGGEYRLGEQGEMAVRAGYAYDGLVSNSSYPTAFGTPPAPTHVFTAGAGYEAENWELNFAIAHRRGDATVTADNVAAGDLGFCAFCSSPGDYRIRLLAAYIDFSYEFGGDDEAAHEEEDLEEESAEIEPPAGSSADSAIEELTEDVQVADQV